MPRTNAGKSNRKVVKPVVEEVVEEELTKEELEKQRIGELVDVVVPLLSVQGWDITIEYRKEVVVNGEAAQAAIAIFPSLLEAVIFMDDTYSLPEKMQAMIHELFHLSQHEVIYLAQELDAYVREPELSILSRRLTKSIEPACIRGCRALYMFLSSTFPELSEGTQGRPVSGPEPAKGKKRDSITSIELQDLGNGAAYEILV
jgi:hypothetical protein